MWTHAQASHWLTVLNLIYKLTAITITYAAAEAAAGGNHIRVQWANSV